MKGSTIGGADRLIDYELGHGSRELERLDEQAQIVAPITLRLFHEASIVQGMRVLDVGSGAGHVAHLAAELVGPTGEVIGIDRAATAVAAAQALVRARTLHQVSFREGDPTEITFERPFDAVVGRYVLMFQPDPAAMLRKIRRHLRPGGGVIAFHESHLTSAHRSTDRGRPPRRSPWRNRECCQAYGGSGRPAPRLDRPALPAVDLRHRGPPASCCPS